VLKPARIQLTDEQKRLLDASELTLLHLLGFPHELARHGDPLVAVKAPMLSLTDYAIVPYPHPVGNILEDEVDFEFTGE